MRSLKPGRFVNTPHGDGVVFETKDSPDIVVHLINKEGETIKKRSYQLSAIKLTDNPIKTRVAAE